MFELKNTNYITLLSLTRAKKINNYNQIIASCYKMENFILNKIQLEQIYSKMKLYNIPNLWIIIITDRKIDGLEKNSLIENIGYNLIYYYINFDLFFKTFNDLNKKESFKPIYVFENYLWEEIVTRFKKIDIIISGGSTNKKHLLSPIEIKLSQFILLLKGFNWANAVNSFYNNRVYDNTSYKDIDNFFIENNNNNILYDKNKSIIELNKEYEDTSSINFNKKQNIKYLLKLNKRSYHTSSLSKNIHKDNNILSYMESLREIINNNNLTSYDKQKIIEKSWLKNFKNKLNDEKFILTRESHKLNKILYKACETLEIMYNNKDLKRKFPLLFEYLNNSDLIFVTFSYVIYSYLKYNYTALCESTGKTLYYHIYINYIKIDNNESYNEFLSSNKIEIRDFIKLGDFFINLLSHFPHDLFYREFYNYMYYTHDPSKLAINDIYLEDIRENIIIHPSNLPMVCQPVEWSDSSFGGYLENKNIKSSLITGSTYHNHKIENIHNLYKTINTINSIKFSINIDLLDYINNDGSFLLEKLNNNEELQRLLTLKIAD